MLILAGVSLNAIVGDNGIITNAQQASFKSGMAVLEEWLQEEYVKYYEDYIDYTNKPELLAAKIPGIFLKDGTKNYITNDNKVYYLINKANLPEDIKKQLLGGDENSYSKYMRLQDVYGVTSDLKVYYCNAETGSFIGETGGIDIDPNMPVAKINNNSIMKSAITDALADIGINVNEETGITYGNISSLTELKIDGKKYPQISTLSAISELTSLKRLILSEVKLSDLDGLQNCVLLNYIYIDNCEIEDYSKLSTVLGLETLYMYIPNNVSEQDANHRVEKLSNGLKDATDLKKIIKFGISGYESMLSNKLKYDGDSNSNVVTNNINISATQKSNFSNTDCLKSLATNIKTSIKYLYFGGNNITSLEFADELSNLYEVDIMCNSNLTNLDGLENKSNLKYVGAQYCNLTDITGLEGCNNLYYLCIYKNINLSSLAGISNCNKLWKILANSCNLTDISALSGNNLKGLADLKYLSLYGNVNLVYVSSIGKCTNLNNLYLASNESMQINDVQELESIINNCGTNYSLPTKYLKYFSSVTTYDYANYNLNDYSEEIIALKSKGDKITFLRLSNNTNLGKSRIGIHLKKGNVKFEELDSIVSSLKLTSEENMIIDGWKSYNETSINNLSDSQIESMENENDIYIRYLLSKLTNLKQLSIAGLTNITSLDFFNTFPTNNLLGELDLKGTTITDLSILEGRMNKLYALVISNTSIDLSKIQTVINSVSSNKPEGTDNYRVSVITGTSLSSNNSGLMLASSGFNFSKCTQVTKLRFNTQSVNSYTGSGYVIDLTGMTNLESISSTGSRNHYILPSSLTEASVIAGGTADYSCCTSLTNVSKGWSNDGDYLKDLQTLGNAPIRTLNIGYCNNDITLLDKYLTKAKETLVSLNVSGLENRMMKGTCESLKNFKNLERIDAQSGVEPTFLNGVKNLKKLKYLYASNNDITAIAEIGECTLLKVLDLANNKISDITEIGNLTNLSTLKLNNNNITDISALKKLIVNGKLNFTSLNLSNNVLQNTTTTGSSNIKILLDLYDAGLRTLDISGNLFSDVEELQQKYGSSLIV